MLQEAIDKLKGFIEDDPSDLAGYMTLGGLFNREKRYREAADVYDDAVAQLGKVEKHHWNLFFRRGIAYERLKEWEKAEPNFKRSLELSANQPEVLNYLGYSWLEMGRNLDQAMDMIRKAVEQRPEDGYIVDSLGWGYYRTGDFENAVKELERAVELRPIDPVINDHFGDALWRVGRKREAAFQWRRALSFEPEDKDRLRIVRKLDIGLDAVLEEEAEDAASGAAGATANDGG